MDTITKLIGEMKMEYESIEKTFARESEVISTTINSNIEKARSVRNELQSVFDRLNSQVLPLEARIVSLNADIRTKEGELKNITAAVESKNEIFNKSTNDREQTLKELDVKITKAMATYDSLIAEKKEIADSTSKQLAALNKIETGLKQAENELSVLESRKDRLTAECGDLSNEKDVLNIDLRAKRETVASLEKIINK